VFPIRSLGEPNI